MSIRVGFSFYDLEKIIEGFGSSYHHMIDEMRVETQLYYEVDGWNLVFVVDHIDDLKLVEDDLCTVINFIEARIDEAEQEENERIERQAM